MTITVDGVDLQTLAWNIRTLGPRLRAAAPRGTNTAVAGADGAVWLPDKPLDELQFELSMVILGCGHDGSMPRDGSGRAAIRSRVDQLLELFGRTDRLVEVIDTARARRTHVELLQPFDMTTTAGGTRGEVALELNAPAGCWEDIDPVDTGPVALTAGGDVELPGVAGGTVAPAGPRIELTGPGRNIRITTDRGAWLQVTGDLPAAGLVIDAQASTAWPADDPTSTAMKTVRWAPGPGMLPLGHVPAVDPVLRVEAEATSTDSRIRISTRRRWRTA